MPTFSVQVNVIVNATTAEEARQFVQNGIDYALDAADTQEDDEGTPIGVQSASIGEVEVV